MFVLWHDYPLLKSSPSIYIKPVDIILVPDDLNLETLTNSIWPALMTIGMGDIVILIIDILIIFRYYRYFWTSPIPSQNVALRSANETLL